MRDEQEVQDMRDSIDADATAGGRSKWPGMNYEQGVEAALMWVLGDIDDSPLAD